MRKNLFSRVRVLFALAATVALLAPARASAQTATTTTTLSSSQSQSSQNLSVASATGFVVGYYVYVDHEFERITAISGTYLTVVRAQGGTPQQPHVNGSVVFEGPPTYFISNPVNPTGACTPTNFGNTPQINVLTGNIVFCNTDGQFAGTSYTPRTESTWPRTNVTAAAYTVAPGDVIVAYTSNVAHTVTLPTPSVGMTGRTLMLIDEGGNASGSATFTIVGTINGSTTNTITTAYGLLRLYCTGSAWVKW